MLLQFCFCCSFSHFSVSDCARRLRSDLILFRIMIIIITIIIIIISIIIITTIVIIIVRLNPRTY